ncbi:MAG: spore germination protein GerW family protein [Pseudomonadota bacterium]
MQDVENLLKTAVSEVERLLDTNAVVGEPIKVEGSTIIPLVSFGFGFGAGGGTGKMGVAEGEGMGGGTGAGAGIKPVAVLIIDNHGVRLQPIKGATTSVMGKLVDTLGKAAQKRTATLRD